MGYRLSKEDADKLFGQLTQSRDTGFFLCRNNIR